MIALMLFTFLTKLLVLGKMKILGNTNHIFKIFMEVMRRKLYLLPLWEHQKPVQRGPRALGPVT